MDNLCPNSLREGDREGAGIAIALRSRREAKDDTEDDNDAAFSDLRRELAREIFGGDKRDSSGLIAVDV
jgi:hypothetical protein